MVFSLKKKGINSMLKLCILFNNYIKNREILGTAERNIKDLQKNLKQQIDFMKTYNST